jgi:hypothetical protein
VTLLVGAAALALVSVTAFVACWATTDERATDDADDEPPGDA